MRFFANFANYYNKKLFLLKNSIKMRTLIISYQLSRNALIYLNSNFQVLLLPCSNLLKNK